MHAASSPPSPRRARSARPGRPTPAGGCAPPYQRCYSTPPNPLLWLCALHMPACCCASPGSAAVMPACWRVGPLGGEGCWSERGRPHCMLCGHAPAAGPALPGESSSAAYQRALSAGSKVHGAGSDVKGATNLMASPPVNGCVLLLLLLRNCRGCQDVHVRRLGHCHVCSAWNAQNGGARHARNRISHGSRVS